MTKFRDLRKRLPARSMFLTAPRLTRVESRVRSRNCLTNGNFLSSGMRRSRTAAIGITHAITLCGRTLGASHYSSPAFTISTNAAKAANRGILRRETLLVSEIVASPHPRLRRSCLAQVDLVLRSAILRCKYKIAKLMCAQKPQSRRGGVFSKSHGEYFCLCKKIRVSKVFSSKISPCTTARRRRSARANPRR